MAHTHNGGFVVMPGRDYASTDHVYGTRNFPTACAALILSVKEKRFRVTGASSTGGSLSKKEGLSRPARQLSAEKKEKLDHALLFSLGELGKSGDLKPLPMELSKATTKVSFSGVESDSRLTFSAINSNSKASFTFDELTPKDHTLLARLLAELKQSDIEAQATAGIYLELSGDTATADLYYARAGKEFVEKLESLFEK